jgi:hypothetical protein
MKKENKIKNPPLFRLRKVVERSYDRVSPLRLATIKFFTTHHSPLTLHPSLIQEMQLITKSENQITPTAPRQAS